MIFGKLLASSKTCELFVIQSKATYKAALKTNTPMIIPKLKEKMMINSEAIMETIINANSVKDNPKITARFLMFL